MREIKFRAKLLGSGDLIYFGLTDLHTRNGITSACAIGIDLGTLQQYTGLKDKNDTEIYEGDIIQWDYYKKKRTAEVAWRSVGFWAVGHLDGLSVLNVRYRKLTVIGNISEPRPELLLYKV